MPGPTERNAAIDVARGIAVVLMIQTHVYDGWVASAHRHGLLWATTRFLGIFPLPTFLLLAGIGIALRLEASARRGEPAAAVRRDLLRRGLRVVAAGYLVSAVLGAIDGATDPATYVRADVLHAIGFSIASAALLVVARSPEQRRAHAMFSAAALALLAAALSIPSTRFGRSLDGPARFVAAPFVEVPGITRMPVVPLIAWLGLGILFATVWLDHVRRRRDHLAFAAVCAALAAGAFEFMHHLHREHGGVLDRLHPAASANLVDLGLRASGLVALVLGLGGSFPRRVEGELVRLGRHSLLAYAVHLPWAYGRLVRPVSRNTDLATATLGLLGVLALTWTVVFAFDAFERHRLARASGTERATKA